MQCKEVEDVLEQEGLEVLPDSARAHLASCASCSNFLADLNSILTVARDFPAELEPPARVWISLRNQLEAEGLIATRAATAVDISTEHSSWWQSFAYLLRPRSLALGAVGLLVAFAAGVQLHKARVPAVVLQPTGGTIVAAQAPRNVDSREVTPAKRDSAKPNVEIRQPAAIPAAPPAPLDFGEHDLANMRMAATGAPENSSNSVVDSSLQDSLKQVDSFIGECEKHLKENPNDELAREYLSAAYHQKAELISVMLDRGRSVN